MNEVEDLIINNVNLIYVVLKRLGMYNTESINEYFDVGMMGLVKGANSYDKTYGIKPSTYLCKCIINEILYEIRKTKNKKFDTIPLTSPIYENILLEDMISSDIDVEKEVELKEDKKNLHNALKRLTSDERTIVIYSYGLYGKEILTQRELAVVMGKTQSNICRIKNRSIKKLKKILNNEGDYL